MWLHAQLQGFAGSRALTASTRASEHRRESVSFIMKRVFSQLCIPGGGRVTSRQQDGQVFHSTVSGLGCWHTSGVPLWGTSPKLAATALAWVTQNRPITPQCPLVLAAFSSRRGRPRVGTMPTTLPPGPTGPLRTSSPLPDHAASSHCLGHVHHGTRLTLLWLMAEREDQCIQALFSQL